MQTEAQPTRTRILNAAREIFSENGFHSASMKAICKSCAISPGTLYHHFISKEALIQAIILQDQERALARFREPIEGIHFVDYMVESIVSLTHEAFGQRALVVEIMAEGMRNPQVAAMLKNKHMTITEFVAQRMRDAQQKGEISPDINTSMTSRLLLDLTYGVLADIEAEDLAREASFAQGLRFCRIAPSWCSMRRRRLLTRKTKRRLSRRSRRPCVAGRSSWSRIVSQW